MRILIATPLYPPQSGGPATYSKVLEHGLPAQEIDVALVKFGEVLNYPKGIRHVLYLLNILKAGKTCDALFALDPVSTGFPTMLAAKILRKPYVVKIVGDYAWEQARQRHGVQVSLDDFVHMKELAPTVSLLRWIETLVASGARQVIVPSDYLKNIVMMWGISSQKITVINNAVPQEVIGDIPDVAPKTSALRIVTVGRLVPWKGMHGLISAMAEIRKALPHTELLIVGDGPDKKTLEHYARTRFGDGAVVFTGALSHGEALAVLSTADVFALNSSYEGLSHVLIEAMSLGLPIVATKVGGNPELIEDDKTGILVESGDTSALVSALIRLLTNQELAKKMGIQALERSRDFTIDRMIEHTSAFFKQNI